MRVESKTQEFKKIAPYFSYPLFEASIKLEMEMEDLRRICKENGLNRWPYSYKRNNLVCTKDPFSKFSLQPKQIEIPISKKSNLEPKMIFKIQLKHILN